MIGSFVQDAFFSREHFTSESSLHVEKMKNFSQVSRAFLRRNTGKRHLPIKISKNEKQIQKIQFYIVKGAIGNFIATREIEKLLASKGTEFKQRSFIFNLSLPYYQNMFCILIFESY